MIVSEDICNRLSDDVIVAPIFSAGRLGPTRVSIRAGQDGMLPESVIFCEEVTTLHRVLLVDGPLGRTIPPTVLGRIYRAIRRALGEVVPEPP